MITTSGSSHKESHEGSSMDTTDPEGSNSEISRYGLNLLIAVSDSVREDSFPTNRTELEVRPIRPICAGLVTPTLHIVG